MHLNKASKLAINVLARCAACDGKPVKCATLSRNLSASLDNVHKIVWSLSQAGFVETTRGHSGGVRLALDPATIRLSDVVRRFESIDCHIDAQSVGENAAGSAASAAVNTILRQAAEAFMTALDEHTFDRLVP